MTKRFEDDLRQLRIDFIRRRSEFILEGMMDDYLPEEFLEDLATNDEKPYFFLARGFLLTYYDEDTSHAILEGLFDNIYG